MKYLGFGFRFYSGKWHAAAHEISAQKLKEKIKSITSRSWSISLELRLYKLRQVIKGWISCYGISDGIKSRLTEIDSWLRFRSRMMIRKQWKTIQEREWGLLKPGCKRAQAHSYACARQFYARCASTFLNKFITNSRLSKQGLIKCTEYIEKAHARALERAAGGTPACPVV
ncbi:MAG: hypothetical protein HUJ54_08020 [Erysipelotrichaceae bacterium]|nr:hypothetical protein [Erysipelotrichaceae bacterium]